MGVYFPEDLKPPSLAMFDGRNDPYKNVAFVNTHMVIIGAPDYLKCKLLYYTFRDAALWWYMGLPRAYFDISQELVKKLVHHFAASRHRKMSTASLFNIR